MSANVGEICALRANEITLKQRIACLERQLYGIKPDRSAYKAADDQPELFDEMFKQALEEKAAQVERMAEKNREGSRKTAQDENRKEAEQSGAMPSTEVECGETRCTSYWNLSVRFSLRISDIGMGK